MYPCDAPRLAHRVVHVDNNNNNNNNYDNVYGTIIVTKVIARVYPERRVAANRQTKPIDLRCESAENWQLPSTSTFAIIIITTQPVN